MPKKEIGKVIRVALREIWRKEDKDFTTWLEKNIDSLKEILDFDISIESREKNVGPFKVDLYGEDSNGRKVIIENQLERTNHDHLGKLLTYMVNLDAKVAIWIAKEPTEQHAKVIDWINEITPEDTALYLIKIEAIQIEGQPAVAPLFTIIKGPSIDSKKIGSEKHEYAQRHITMKKFWEQLLEKSNQRTKLFKNISPIPSDWINASSGKSGIVFGYSLTKNSGMVEIYFNKGGEMGPKINKSRFDALYKYKNEIEKEFGAPLVWQRLNGRRTSRILYKFNIGGWSDESKWDELQDKMVDAMVRLEKAFKKYISKID